MARKTPATMQRAADGGNSSDAHVCHETATGVGRARAAPIAKSTLPFPRLWPADGPLQKYVNGP